MTQREFEARMVWIDGEMDRPSREDWYLMQVAAEMRRTRVKSPQDVKLADMRLKIDRPKEAVPVTREDAAARSKSHWFGMLGIGREKKHGT